jgi:metal-responsive CopG/Arc/MetJ family transcriptional regulator
MRKTKVAVTLNSELLDELDELIAQDRFPNRSQAIEAALAEKLARLAKTRLAREAARLNPDEEKSLAEEGMGAELGAWPEY